MFEDDDSRWLAVQCRDANADGCFIYAVKTTKIYCRPICKARLARRVNVAFYATPGAARTAGFRACKRCTPDAVGCMPEDAAVRKIRAFVRDHHGGDSSDSNSSISSLGQMARQTGLSKWHFHRVFKKCVGMTPYAFIRMQQQSTGDQAGELDVTESAITESGSETSWPSDFILSNNTDFDLARDAGADPSHDNGSLKESDGCSIVSPSGTAYNPQRASSWQFDDFLIWPDGTYDDY